MTFTLNVRPLLALLVLALVPAVAVGADEAKPAVAGYSTFAAMRVQLEAIAAADVATLESLGRTLGGRDVFLLRIGTGKLDEKPAILLLGSVDPAQPLGSELAVRIARRLVDGAKADERIRKMLDQVTFYVIPRPAPDAYEALFTRPYRERSVNPRPVDDDHDGRVDEDGPDDLDGNGWITMMRVEDPSGEWMVHPNDARVMIKADPAKNEQGQYKLYSEGIDNDHDELFNEDPPGGVALDRNFTFEYPYFEPDAGPHQVSEAETRAVADFAFSHPNIAAVFSFTPEDNLTHPWKPNPAAEKQRTKTSVLADDAAYLDLLGEEYQKIQGGKDAPESPEGNGSLARWAYFHYGRWSLGARGWWIPKVEKKEDKSAEKKDGDGAKEAKPEEEKKEVKPAEEKRGADELNALRWLEREKIDGFVPWKKFTHPDFPGRKVEVGGFRPFVRWTPPEKELDGLAKKHQAFLAWLVQRMPRLAIEEVKVESLGEGVYRVTAAVLNRGYLPTTSKMGETAREPHPLQIALELPEGATLVTGYARVRLPALAGNGGRAEQTWLVRTDGGKPATVPIRVWSPSVGEVRAEAKLTK